MPGEGERGGGREQFWGAGLSPTPVPQAELQLAPSRRPGAEEEARLAI